MVIQAAPRSVPFLGVFERATGKTSDARVCIGIATRGRPDVLHAIMHRLSAQTLQPTSILVACTEKADIGAADCADIQVIYAEPGAARQRNAVLQNLPADAEFVVFFDDDFLPQPNWLEAAVDAFRSDQTLGGVTGLVIADGIKGPGFTMEEGNRLLQNDQRCDVDLCLEGYSPYGCNMAFRCAAIRNCRFDERLVLYSWLEDVDFGAALARDGWRLIKIGTARGVHLGIKVGRVAGRRFGYSQVINPAYLQRKGSMSRSVMARQIGRNVLANIAGSWAPEPFIDRRGRLRGNIIAFLDLLRGRLTPERAERI